MYRAIPRRISPTTTSTPLTQLSSAPNRGGNRAIVPRAATSVNQSWSCRSVKYMIKPSPSLVSTPPTIGPPIFSAQEMPPPSAWGIKKTPRPVKRMNINQWTHQKIFWLGPPVVGGGVTVDPPPEGGGVTTALHSGRLAFTGLLHFCPRSASSHHAFHHLPGPSNTEPPPPEPEPESGTGA